MNLSRTCAVVTSDSPIVAILKQQHTQSPHAVDYVSQAATLQTRYRPERGPRCTASLQPEHILRRLQVSFEFPLTVDSTKTHKAAHKVLPPHHNNNNYYSPKGVTDAGEEVVPNMPNTPHVHIDPANPICKFLRPEDLVSGSASPPVRAALKSPKCHKVVVKDPSANAISASKRKAPAASTKCSPAAPPTATTATTNTVPGSMCSVWNLRSVAPLIQWLHAKSVRYTHSDWEVQMANGERERIVTQHGELIRDTQTVHQKSYMCHDGFRQGVWLRVLSEEIIDTSSHLPTTAALNWWPIRRNDIMPVAAKPVGSDHTTKTTKTTIPHQSAKAKVLKVPPESIHDRATDVGKVSAPLLEPRDTHPPVAAQPRYMDGTYHNCRQHRIYHWSPNVHIHLYTTDAKHYRVVVEHVHHPSLSPTAEPSETYGATTEHCEHRSFQKLVNDLAYHFSQHVQRQRGGKGLK
jgi:hypothetical protein